MSTCPPGPSRPHLAGSGPPPARASLEVVHARLVHPGPASTLPACWYSEETSAARPPASSSPTTRGLTRGRGAASGGNPTAHPATAAAALGQALGQALAGIDPSRYGRPSSAWPGAAPCRSRRSGCVCTDLGRSRARRYAGVRRRPGCGVRLRDGRAGWHRADRRHGGSRRRGDRPQGRTTAGGHGWLLGDEGSGFWLGREAVRAALRALDAAAPAARRVGAQRRRGHRLTGRGLIQAVNSRPPIRLAELAPLVTAAYEARRSGGGRHRRAGRASTSPTSIVSLVLRAPPVRLRLLRQQRSHDRRERAGGATEPGFDYQASPGRHSQLIGAVRSRGGD